MGKLPLQGIRILDFTVVWAGPFATMLLADYGAALARSERSRAPARPIWNDTASLDR